MPRASCTTGEGIPWRTGHGADETRCMLLAGWPASLRSCEPSTSRCCSSIIERMSGSVSQGFGNRLWPFDMGGGNPINCTTDAMHTQLCSADHSLPGLWEVPGEPRRPRCIRA
jgi:hypothetical protein